MTTTKNKCCESCWVWKELSGGSCSNPSCPNCHSPTELTWREIMEKEHSTDWRKGLETYLDSVSKFFGGCNNARPLRIEVSPTKLEKDLKSFIASVESAAIKNTKEELRGRIEGMKKKTLGTDQNGTELYRAGSGDIYYNQALSDLLDKLTHLA